MFGLLLLTFLGYCLGDESHKDFFFSGSLPKNFSVSERFYILKNSTVREHVDISFNQSVHFEDETDMYDSVDVKGSAYISDHVSLHNSSLHFFEGSKSHWNGKVKLYNSRIFIDENATLMLSDGAASSLGSLFNNGTLSISGGVTFETPIISSVGSVINVIGANFSADSITSLGTMSLMYSSVYVGAIVLSALSTIDENSTLIILESIIIDSLTALVSGPGSRKLLAASHVPQGICIVEPAATISGTGHLDCNIINSGTVTPNKTISCTSIIQEPTSLAVFSVPSAHIVSTGDVTLDGSLNINFLVAQNAGDTFIFITSTYGIVHGTFDQITFTGLSESQDIEVTVTSNSFGVTVVTKPHKSHVVTIIACTLVGALVAVIGVFLFKRHSIQKNIIKIPSSAVTTNNPLFIV